MRARHSDVASEVGEWFDLHAARLHRYIARRVGSTAAQDIVAETFRIAIERYEKYDPSRASASSWLFGIATNLVQHHWRDELRRLRAYRAAAEPRLTATATADDAARIDATNTLERLAVEVAELPQDDRDVLILTVWEELTSAEVAEVLGIPPGTVRSRLNRIRTRLRAVTEQAVDSPEVWS